MDHATLVNSETIRNMAKERWFITTVTLMKVVSKLMSCMAKVHSLTIMDLSTREHGTTTGNMAMVR